MGQYGNHACPACGRMRYARKGQRCTPCFLAATMAASKAEGPRPTDPPQLHQYHARAMAGAPLFPARRERRPHA